MRIMSGIGRNSLVRSATGRRLDGRAQRRRRSTLGGVGMLGLLACAVSLGGCILERKLGIGFANDLGEPVDIVYLVDPEVIVGPGLHHRRRRGPHR